MLYSRFYRAFFVKANESYRKTSLFRLVLFKNIYLHL